MHARVFHYFRTQDVSAIFIFLYIRHRNFNDGTLKTIGENYLITPGDRTHVLILPFFTSQVEEIVMSYQGDLLVDNFLVIVLL